MTRVLTERRWVGNKKKKYGFDVSKMTRQLAATTVNFGVAVAKRKKKKREVESHRAY